MFAAMDDIRSKMICSYTDITHESRSELTDPLSILLEARFEPCQVCGEQSSGLHCGAITCEACKKFFLRSINGEDQKYKCVRNKDCIITRNNRTQCQYCRFQKCKTIGMTVKEGAEIQQTPRVADIFAQISCYVCQAPSSGIHFGAITCEGCKGFFRRSIKERAPSRYKCMDNGTCEINVATRNACRYCRFQRCIKVGSRIGRQSNLFKHHMRMMLQRNGQIPNATMLHQMVHSTSSSSRNKASNRKRTISESSSSESEFTQSTSTIIDFEDQLDHQSKELISNVHKAFKETLDNLPICQDTGNPWLSSMNQFKNYANRSVKFATRIPGFMNFHNVNDQIQLIKSSIHSIIILCLQRLNNSFMWNYFNVIDQKLHEQFQQIFPFIEHIRSDGEKIQAYIYSLKLDEKEFSLLLSLLIISTSNIHLNDFLLIDSTQTELTCALCDYMDSKRGSKSRDFYTLMFLLPSLRKLNAIIQDHIRNEVPKNIEFPAFFSRVYLNEQDINYQQNYDGTIENQQTEF
ncbi:unnamed protein product [Rotaria sp. Silwood1]|nr:unnamed protein product [Rotaria sp. Silwood1]CAF0844722.1 unnamed protein product [Rotaria sp. Silwood1]CAF0955784.1 unnamed protein product [Rotaria sp. Silwood1]CAF3373603.1 unnamed protein product [Rotaria sp. Silwood1]CAF4790830.1 unnamed protein product [Rotaria sp. Silwood1]